jgi:hypothetical protein
MSWLNTSFTGKSWASVKLRGSSTKSMSRLKLIQVVIY